MSLGRKKSQVESALWNMLVIRINKDQRNNHQQKEIKANVVHQLTPPKSPGNNSSS